mgnify:FL=1
MAEGRPRFLVLHGPNLNLLGRREPDIYGTATLADIDDALRRRGDALGVDVECHQSNHEGVLIDLIHGALGRCRGVVFNPGAYTHTSVALRDAVAAVALPVVEVHLSNTEAREDFRRVSLLGAVCLGRIMGFGARSYTLALDALIDHVGLR